MSKHKRKQEMPQPPGKQAPACRGAELGTLNGGEFSSAMAANLTGRVVVGFAADGGADNAMRAFRWTKDEGMVSLGTLNDGAHSCAYAVSPSGDVIVGCSADGAYSNAVRAFRWTKSEGMESLGALDGGHYSEARSVNATGDVILGWSTVDDGNFVAFVWTPESGIQRLDQTGYDAVGAVEALGANPGGDMAADTFACCPLCAPGAQGAGSKEEGNMV